MSGQPIDIKDLREDHHNLKPDFTATIDNNHVTEIDENPDVSGSPLPQPHKPTKKSKFSLKNLTNLTKKQIIIIVVISVVLIVGIVVLLVFLLSGNKKQAPVVRISRPKVVTQVPAKIITSPLTGMPVTNAQSVLPVTAVMIENSDQARPQSGLSQAGVIFEAQAEGGITRFMALYQEGSPSSIGPIRSARPYYIDWMLPFNASYVHVGGSPTALNLITTDNVKNLDEFYNGSYFTRITSRIAPHNVYTSMSRLNALEQSKGYSFTPFTGFPRKPDSPSKLPNVTSIDMNISWQDYEIHYDYNAKNNSYLRSEAGSPMIDANTNTQLDPKVVIAMIVPFSQGALDSTGAYYSVYGDIGSGTAYVFQDGTVTIGTWTKTSPTSQIQFKNSSGGTLYLNAGQTWISAIGSSSLVTYK